MSDTTARKFLQAYSSPFWRSVLDREAEYLRSEIAHCKRILDVGCGVGALGNRLKEFPILGLDLSRSMLAEAIKGGGDYVAGDARMLCFKPATFDAVIFVTSLEFMDDYRSALSEAAGSLVEGGRLVAMMLNPRSRHFRDRVNKEGSFFKSIKLLDPALVGDYASNFFRVESEYFLGIDGDKVFDSSDETLAALYIIKARRLSPRRA